MSVAEVEIVDDAEAVESGDDVVLDSKGLATLREADKEIAKLREKYMSLTIAGPDDKKGAEAVHCARMDARSVRVQVQKDGKELRASAIAFQKAVIAEEKRIVDLIAPIELHLTQVEDEYKAQVKAIKEAKAAEAHKALQERVDKLAAVGFSAPDVAALGDMDADMFNHFLDAQTVKFKAEQERLAKEKAEQEAAEKDRLEAEAAEREKVRKEREELEKLRAEMKAEQERKDAELQAERERLEAEQRKIAEEQRRIEAEKAAAARKKELEQAAAEEAAAAKRAEELRPIKERLSVIPDAVLAVEIPAVEHEATGLIRDVLQQAAATIRGIVESIE